MGNLHKGDQYAMPFTFTDGEGHAITPDTIERFRVRYGTIEHEYNGNGLLEDGIAWSEALGKWLFLVTESETLKQGEVVEAEAQGDFGAIDGTDLRILRKTGVQRHAVDSSLWTGVWNE